MASSAASTAAAAQNITGTVTDLASQPLQGVHVSFFDAANAELLGTAETAFDGIYDSGPIPAGSYRVQFSDPSGATTGKDPGPGFYVPEFFGANGLDQFCAGLPVEVLKSSSTGMVDAQMGRSTPVKVVPHSGDISGTVRDAGTGAPLEGIFVSVLDAVAATQVRFTETDGHGSYGVKLPEVALRDGTVRIRRPASCRNSSAQRQTRSATAATWA